MILVNCLRHIWYIAQEPWIIECTVVFNSVRLKEFSRNMEDDGILPCIWNIQYIYASYIQLFDYNIYEFINVQTIINRIIFA